MKGLKDIVAALAIQFSRLCESGTVLTSFAIASRGRNGKRSRRTRSYYLPRIIWNVILVKLVRVQQLLSLNQFGSSAVR